MANDQMDSLIEHLRRAVLAGGKADLTDGQLLDDYISHRDEAAIAALVRRHGPMVWGVCRRVLRNRHDAEDAFQATFLVLVRKVESILPREMVGNWLYGVAHQTALKVRATAAKRQARERQVKEMPEPAVMPEPDLWANLEPQLDQELSRLPDKYRVAVVLCDLEGKTRKEVARQLKIPEGTLSSRLTTARRMLAKRLARHGQALSVGALAAVLTKHAASAGVPPSVVSATIKAVTLVAAGQAATTGVISAQVAALTEGVMKSMLLTKLKTVMVLFLVAALCAAGGLIYHTQAAEQPKARQKDESSTAPPTDSENDKPKKDAAGKVDQPRMLDVRLRQVKSDDKQPVIGFDLDRYYAELDDRGLPRTKLPTTRNVEVLIDGHKASLTDLLPGDRIALQLTPDNKSVAKIHLTLKPRLDALEKEVGVLRQRIKRLQTEK